MSLERVIADWMADEAVGGDPDEIADRVITTTGPLRPLPRWLAVLREPSMHAQTRVAVGMPMRQVALVAILMLVIAAIVIGVGAALIQRPSSSEEWPGYRGDAARNGAAIHGPIGNPVVAWQFKAGGGVASALAISHDLVLAPSDDGTLHALAIGDGGERWTFTAPGPIHGPFVHGDTVYVADGAGIVHALGIADGRPIWASTTPIKNPSDLTVTGNQLIAGTGDGDLVAIDLATGTESWRATVAPKPVAVHAPAAADGTVVTATDDGYLTAVDAGSRAIRWQVKPDVGDGSLGTPVISGGVAYIGMAPESRGGRLLAYELTSGAERWHVDANVYAPSIAGATGYTGSATGHVAAIDLATGTEQWATTFEGVVRAPAIAGDIAYLAADHERAVVALDRATGLELWRSPIDGSDPCCIAVANGRVLVGTSAGTVYAIGGDGAALTAKAPVTPPPATAATAPPPSAPPAVAPLETKLVWAVDNGTSDFVPWTLSRAPDGRLWAAEGIKDRFDIFEADGTFVESWGTSGTGDGELDLTRANGDPYGMVAFAPDGSFFVLDAGNRRIQHFSRDRHFLNAWGRFGSAPGQFTDPVGLVVEPGGRVDVLDNGRGVIETYDAHGNVAATIPAFPPEVGANEGANQVALGPNGHFYLSVTVPNEVVEIERDGKYVTKYGSAGPGAFTEQPGAMGWDAKGRLYVTQGPLRGDHPGVQVFAADGTYLGGFGPYGGGEAQLGFTTGIVVVADGIYVDDAGGLPGYGLSSKVRKFAPISFP